jgi:hypothetical protein
MERPVLRGECLVKGEDVGLQLEASAASLAVVPPTDTNLLRSGSNRMLIGPLRRWGLWGPFVDPICQRALLRNCPHPNASWSRTTKPRYAGPSLRCAEEDSNSHSVVPDQALNLVG